MARKSIVTANLEKGQICNNCGLSYRKFMSREEKKAWDEEHKEFIPNTCGSRLRKKLDLPKDATCEHWHNGTETFSAENKLAEEKKEKEKAAEKAI